MVKFVLYEKFKGERLDGRVKFNYSFVSPYVRQKVGVGVGAISRPHNEENQTSG